MSKRKLKKRELVTLVFASDVTKDGRFKNGYRIHVGRINHRNGQIMGIACKAKGLIRWSYYFNAYTFSHLILCQSCLQAIHRQLDEEIDVSGLIEVTPASNTGVN